MPRSASGAVYTAAVAVAHTGLRALAPSASKMGRAVRGMAGAVARLEDWARTGGRDPARHLVWFHAPSVGEGFQARAVMEALRTLRPEIQLVYTYFSPSAETFARTLPADVVDYLPPDLPGSVTRALDSIRPDAIVFSKTEIWPNLTLHASERRIPVALLSATLPASSSRLRFPVAPLLRKPHARLARLGAISRDDAERFKRLGVTPEALRIMGDARFDQVWRRAVASNPESPLLAPFGGHDGPTLVAGSTWPPDEAVLVDALAGSFGLHPRPRLVIAPHEPTPEALSSLEVRLARVSSRIQRLSSIGRHTDAEVLIIDRVGVLGELYRLGDVAYVGGGFGRAGLHSVLEPAAFGSPVLFGPRHGNAREAAELIQRGGARSIADAAELRTALEEWLGDSASRCAAGAAARSYVEEGVGAADRGARMVIELLEER